MSHGQKKALWISLLILILLLGIYRREDVWAGTKVVASFCRETCVKIGDYHEKAKEERAQKKAEREAKKAEEERLKREAEEQKRLAEEAAKAQASSKNIPDKELFSDRIFSPEELDLLKEQNGTVFTAGDGSRYVTLTYTTNADNTPEMRYLLIPTEVDNVSFRAVDDFVYSCAAAKLYGNPTLSQMAVKTAGAWEQFKRVGISESCVYQLVTQSGQIVYADGRYFRRNPENMDLTENIRMAKERVVLDVDHISQNPTLPNGCEITSLATVLNYLGYDVSKETLADQYLPKAAAGEANFYEEFVGNPRSKDAYGCYAGAIVNAANAYLAAVGSEQRAYDYTGSLMQDILGVVRNGTPVVVWATAYMEEDPGYTTQWIVDGEYLVWKANLHCVVLIGYDTNEGTVIVSDPMRGIEEYDMDTFVKRFRQFYSQAVVIL